MHRLPLSLLAVATLAGCGSPPTFDHVVIGTRRGELEAVDPAEEVEAGSRQDLAATVDVGAVGWVHVTWTAWDADGPRVVKALTINLTEPTTLFSGLDGDSEGGWRAGTITCDFKTAEGRVAAAKIRVTPNR